jgi:hypothetical protein
LRRGGRGDRGSCWLGRRARRGRSANERWRRKPISKKTDQ